MQAARPEPPTRGERRQPSRSRLRPTTVFALFAAAALILAGAITIATVTQRPSVDGSSDGVSRWRGVELSQPVRRPDVVLTDTDGRPFDFRARTEGKFTLLMFGYTNCPDVCPIQLATITGALRADPGVTPQVVFVSVDPDRDTPGRLRQWLDQFSRDYIGLTGTTEQLRLAQERAGVPEAILSAPSGDQTYSVGHASQVIAFTPDDLAHVVYPFGLRQEDWVHDLRQLAQEPGWSTR